MKYLPFSQTKIVNSFFKPARISPKQKEEQAEDSSPHPV